MGYNKDMEDTISHDYSNLNIPIDDPHFHARIFSVAARERKAGQAKDGDNIRRVCAEEYNELSLRLDRTGIQDSCSVRNVLRTRRLANLLISDKGELHSSLIPQMISSLAASFYSLGPQRQYDSIRHNHILSVLKSIQESKELERHLKQISKPHLHPLADQMIRDTLQLPHSTAISDAHAQRAALSAWMCYLRQNIGSCFATAPAIIIHDEQPELFLKDIKELLATGRLKRTYGGVEYSVPISGSWGSGDLRKPFIMSYEGHSEDSEIWNAPGLIAALEAAEILDKEAGTKEKIRHASELVKEAFPELSAQHPYLLLNVEEVLQRILMLRHGISKQDLEAYSHRPKGMIHSGLMMQMSHSGRGMGGKGEACAQYYFFLDAAETAFKALADNALLKAWEFTIASFSEIKSNFTRWNLYSSLGLGSNDPGGIGQALFEAIKQKLDIYNQKASDLQFEYEHMFAQLKTIETRARSVSSEKEAQWTRAEYQSKMNEFYTLEDMRNQAHTKAQTFANLFNFLIDYYDQMFPQYFQEVYNPDLHEVETGPFDDSPAGFRLLYKHGRSNTAQWTKIKNPDEFIDALSNFFVSTETELTSKQELEGLHADVSDIVTAIVTHIKTKDFLESAFHRMAAAHRVPAIADPLEHLEKIQAKPWAYISGGTMNTLVSCYYRREQQPTETARWVESPLELLVFLVDTLKQAPPAVTAEYAKNPQKALLMHSPTHAFLLKPGLSPFREAWQSDAYTYTWVRDNLVQPMKQFADSLMLDEAMMEYFIELFQTMIPLQFRHYFYRVFMPIQGHMIPGDFRDYVLDRIENERGLQYGKRGLLSAEEIDSAMYQMLPMFSSGDLRDRIANILQNVQELSPEIREACLALFDENRLKWQASRRVIPAQALHEICCALLCAAYKATSLPFDAQSHISLAAQSLGYAMPYPVMFSDTNWVRNLFGFVVNPCTSLLELWRLDPLGRTGAPMHSWKEWLNGSRKDITWGIYTRPGEYR